MSPVVLTAILLMSNEKSTRTLTATLTRLHLGRMNTEFGRGICRKRGGETRHRSFTITPIRIALLLLGDVSSEQIVLKVPPSWRSHMGLRQIPHSPAPPEVGPNHKTEKECCHKRLARDFT